MLITYDHLHVDPVYRERLRSCALDSVDSVLSRTEGRVVAWSRTTDTLFVPDEPGFPGFFVKRYYYPRWRNRLRGAFRGTFLGVHRGRAEFSTLRTMQYAGIPAVRPVAYGSRRVARFLSACFLITEAVPDAWNLTTFAQQVAQGRRRLTRRQRIEMIQTLARELSVMHAGALSHGQLYWRNIVTRLSLSGEPEFFFLDAQPIRRFERIGPGAWWRRELAQCGVSALPYTTRSERLRFLRTYFAVDRCTPDLKEHAQEIGEIMNGYRRHEMQRIKMNALFETWNEALDEEQEISGLRQRDEPETPG